MPNHRSKTHEKDSFFSQWLILSIALSIFISAIGFNLYLEHRRTQIREQERLLAQAHVIEANAIQNLISISQILGELRKQRPKTTLDFDLNARLKALADAMPGVRTLSFYDAKGRVSASNQPDLLGKNFKHRTYFKTPQQNPDESALYVSPPFRSVLGIFVIAISMSSTDARGEFSGIVSAGLDPEYFSTLLESARYAPDMRTSIIHWDGDVFMIRPSDDKASGTNLAQPGSFFTLHKDSGQSNNIFTGTTVVTREERMVAFQTIQSSLLKLDKPLVVTASRDLGEIYAVWRKDLIKTGGLSGLIALVSIIALYASQRRQRESNRQLDEANEALQATHALIKESEEKHRAIIETTNTGYVILDANGRVIDANGEYVRLSGHVRLEDILGRPPTEWTANPDRGRSSEGLRKCLEAGYVRNLEIDYVDAQGQTTPIEINATVVHHGAAPQIMSLCRNISQRKQAEARLLESRSNLRDALNELELVLKNASLGICTVAPRQDGHRVIQRANSALEITLGYEHGTLDGLDTQVLFRNKDDYDLVSTAYAQVTRSGDTYHGEHELLRSDGRAFFAAMSGSAIDPDNLGGGLIWIIEDISERRRDQDQIKQLAYNDTLTNLPNRRLMLERLNMALAQAKRFHRFLAIMFMDIDFFKQINDTLGHHVGDELLIAVAERLKSCVRDGDTVSRQGGDEFVIVLTELVRPEDASLIAEKIISAIRKPVIVHEHTLQITVSLGLAIYPAEGAENPQDLMKKADIAMYEAKNDGRNGFRIYR